MQIFSLLVVLLAGSAPAVACAQVALPPAAVTAVVTAAAPTDTTALKRGYSLFRPVPQALLRAFSPDRPGIVQSAHTVDAGHFQVEIDLGRLRREQQAAESQRTLTLADVTVKLGLTRTLDAHVSFQPYLRQRVVAASGATETQRGVGDATLRLKQNLYGNDAPHALALALSGYLRLPTSPVGAGRPELGLALPLEYEFSKALELEAQVEGEWLYDPAAARRELHFNHSLLLDYRFGPAHRLEVFAEAASFWNTRQRTWQGTGNLGPAFYLTPTVRLDAGAHVPISRTPRTREFFAGMSWRW